jgi:hypothetical protein
VKPICRFCGSDEGFDQYGEVRVDAWRKVQSITRGEGGEITATFARVESEGGRRFGERDFDPTSYSCIACKREEHRLEDLIGDPVAFAPGAMVICPDGLKGVVETVDFERRRLTVEGWHEEFKFAEVDALRVAA